MVDLSVEIGDLTLQNPITPASGSFSWEYDEFIDLNELGGLVAKTICREPRDGNPTPRMAETEAGIIQSIGLPGKGIDYFLEYNTHHPYNRNNGTMIPNRGYQHIISPGLFFKIGPIPSIEYGSSMICQP